MKGKVWGHGFIIVNATTGYVYFSRYIFLTRALAEEAALGLDDAHRIVRVKLVEDPK